MNPAATTLTSSPSCAAVVNAIDHALVQVAETIASVGTSGYSLPAGELFAGSTIGGHVRHVLDHLRSLLDGRHSGLVDYDGRERGTPEERDAQAALREVARIRAALAGLRSAPSGAPIVIECMPNAASNPERLASTLGRELFFVLTHTVHHSATMRSMALALGASVPATLGYAPSTIAFRNSTACAR